jgi:hypothetical protein
VKKWIAFIGPTLPAREAKKFGCEVRPPARQGDVWRALLHKPRALVLIDGVFESQPSVWHHELRAAIASGIAVFGSSSMGALRAAELHSEGMIGVGKIFRDYRDGTRIDDADVALLHADAEHEFRPLSVPLVNLEDAARKFLRPAQARKMIAQARAVHYSRRRWPKDLPVADLKAEDARECLQTARAWVASNAPAPPARSIDESSHVRRRRLIDALPGALEKLQRAPDADALADAGLRRRLLAGWARAMGLVPELSRVAEALGKIPTRGVAEDQRVRIAEDLALEQQMLATPERWLHDGPSRVEGLFEEAALRKKLPLP